MGDGARRPCPPTRSGARGWRRCAALRAPRMTQTRSGSSAPAPPASCSPTCWHRAGVESVVLGEPQPRLRRKARPRLRARAGHGGPAHAPGPASASSARASSTTASTSTTARPPHPPLRPYRRPHHHGLRPAGAGEGSDPGQPGLGRRPSHSRPRDVACQGLDSGRPRSVTGRGRPSTSSPATSSPAATASTGSALPSIPAGRPHHYDTSTRSPGWGSWPACRPRPTS